MQQVQLYIKSNEDVNGTVTATYSDALIDANASFTDALQGRKIINLTDGGSRRIDSVNSSQSLDLGDVVGSSFGIGDSYSIVDEYELLDTFKDETISLTQSVKNIKDLAKILTDFTQSFTVPASKTNNRIFKHYYESYLSGGLDARFLIDAKINLNGVDFKDGKMRLLGVKMKNGKPSAYNVSFVGNTVSLKTLFGDDELSDLPYLDVFNHSYSYGNVLLYSDFGYSPASSLVTGTITSKTSNSISDSGKDFSIYYPGIESGCEVKNTNQSSQYYGYSEGIVEQETNTKLSVEGTNIFEVGDTYEIVGLTILNDSPLFPQLMYPFISSSKNRYYYNSGHTSEGDHDEIDNVRNIYHSGSPGTTSGHADFHSIQSFDLKPAIKVYYIIKAIEDRYGFTFSSDFFRTFKEESGKPDIDGVFNELYMWCNREAGSLIELIDETSNSTKIEDLTYSSGVDVRSGDYLTVSRLKTDVNEVTTTYFTYTATISATAVSGGSISYDVVLVDSSTNEVYYSEDNVNLSSKTFSKEIEFEGNYGSTNVRPELRISTKGGIQSYSASVTLNKTVRTVIKLWQVTSTSYVGYYSISSQTLSAGVDFRKKILPKFKVFDFLTGLFKMFNLIAYFEGNELVVKTLDQYYLQSNNTTYNIDEYVDIESYKIDRGDIYREINYEFKNANTVFAIESNERTNDEYGNERFKSEGDKIFDGKKYDIKVKFGHMLYENMVDQEDGAFSGITWGYSVSQDFNPVLDGGSLFCNRRLGGNNDLFGELPSNLWMTDKIVGENGSNVNNLLALHTPSNTYNAGILGSQVNTRSINFGSEFDERTNQIENDSLFEIYHKNYILNLYQADSRIVKITAHLPLSILLKYELNDRFIFRGKKYLINSVKTNLQTGKSDIELLSDNYGES